MSYKVVKEFNEFEKEIDKICSEGKVDYDRIDFLLKNGASANACRVTKFDNGDIDEDLLLTECWYYGGSFSEDGKRRTDDDFCIKLLEIFINNGLDVDKYVNTMFGNIQWTYSDKYYVEMTKTILNNLKNKENLDLEESLSGIGAEESYNNCCEQDHKYANALSTIYEMIEKFYKKDLDPNKYYRYDKIINQKIKNVKIFCKDVKIDQPRNFISDDIDIFIECDRDILCIANKYIFVNNNEVVSDYEPLKETNSVTKDNTFEHSLQEYAQNEKIIKISFADFPINLAPKTTAHTTMITIELTNNKAIKIKMDETASFMKVILK